MAVDLENFNLAFITAFEENTPKGRIRKPSTAFLGVIC
jgi:hypothetical protein